MQAIIITAYKDPEMLYRICEKFNKDGYRIFIHIDRRYAGNFDIKRLKAYKRTEVYSKYKISWGSIKHLYTIIALMKRALRHDDVKYLHIISGQDYPVNSIEHAEDNEHIYMTISAVPQERYRQYNFCQKLDQRKRVTEYLYRGSVRLQRIFGINRTHIGRFNEIYKGVIWCSMPEEAARYAIETAKEDNGAFLKDLYTTYLPEEFFFQTIFMNSPEWRTKVIRNNMRYEDWNERDDDRSVPVVLDERDYDAVKYSGAWFARKMDSQRSGELLKMLESEGAPPKRIYYKPLVSIVITTCKRDMDILERAVKSAVVQTYDKKEIIVINDSEEYADRIRRLLDKYPDVRLENNEGKHGVSYVRNLALKISKGEYIAFLDDDDEWLPEKIEKQVKAADRDTGFVYCEISAIKDGRELKTDKNKEYPEGNVLEKLLADNFAGGCSAVMFKRSAAIEAGGFDRSLSFGEDYDLWIRIARKHRVKAVKEKLVRYYIGHESLTGSFERRMAGWRFLLDKYAQDYKSYPLAYDKFTSTIVRETAKNEPMDTALKIWKEYGHFEEFIKGRVMKLLRVY